MSQPSLTGRLILLPLLLHGFSGSVEVADHASTKFSASLDAAEHASLGHVALPERGSKIPPSEHEVLELDGEMSGRGGIRHIIRGTSQRRQCHAQWEFTVGHIPIPTFHISSRFNAVFMS